MSEYTDRTRTLVAVDPEDRELTISCGSTAEDREPTVDFHPLSRRSYMVLLEDDLIHLTAREHDRVSIMADPQLFY
jgi:hypothetical protein